MLLIPGNPWYPFIRYRYTSNFQIIKIFSLRLPFRVGRFKDKGIVSCEFQPLSYFNPSLDSDHNPKIFLNLPIFANHGKNYVKLCAVQHSKESAYISEYLSEFGIGILGCTKESWLFAMSQCCESIWHSTESKTNLSACTEVVKETIYTKIIPRWSFLPYSRKIKI
jgi:hypothetical protein